MTAARTRATTDAQRQRRCRERRGRGCFVARVEVSEAHLDMLTVGALPWLDEKDAHDPQACAVAIGRILDALSKKSVLRVTSSPPELD